MALKTRKPTGMVPPPVILLEGETGSGRSWAAAELSADPRVGRTYWIELGDESTADQYGAIPNVRYELVQPDNSAEVWDWQSLYGACRDFRDEAARAADAGEKPPVLAVDQVGAVWDMLGEWADNRARSSRKSKALLAEDPNAEIDITSNYWNDATARWRKLMSVLLTTKGVVILLSRGEEVTLFQNGQPTSKRTWKVAGQKSLTASMPIWVRMVRDGHPKLIKLRAVVNGIQPGVDREQAQPGFTLAKLIFDRYGWNPAASGYRALTPMVAGSDAPMSEMAAVIELAIDTAETVDQLKSAYQRIGPAVEQQEITEAEGKKLSTFVSARKAQMGQPAETNGRIPAIVGAAA
jgi:head-tail adaptor